MAEMYTYHGALALAVMEGDHGPVIRFLRGREVVTEVYLSRSGAVELARELLRGAQGGFKPPAACKHPNSCHRHGECMYTGCPANDKAAN